MKKLLSIIFVLTVISLIGGSFYGCSATKTTTSNATTLKESTITIGVDSPLTGPAAPWGLAVMHGVTLAADDFNTAGGITVGNTHYTFKITSLDDQFDTATANTNVRTLVNQDGAQYVFEFHATSAMALAPELSNQKVIQFAVCTDPRFLNQPTNSYSFNLFLPYSLTSPKYVAWIQNTYPNVKKMAIMTSNDLQGTLAGQAFADAAKALNITVTSSVLFSSGATDYTSFVTKLLADNPDFLACPGTTPGDAALIINEARGMGFKGLICCKTGASDMISIAGKANLEGVIGDGIAMQAPQVSPTVLALPDREVAKWGNSYAVTWDFYTQATILFTAIQRAHSVDTTAVRNILEDSSQVWPYIALTGATATFNSPEAQAIWGKDALNQISNPFVITVIHNGISTIAAVINP